MIAHLIADDATPARKRVEPRLLRALLSLSTLGWGIGLGAKLFDLAVLAPAWGGAAPGSLALMPYGKAYPVDPGDFFQPLSVLLLVGSVGALAVGRRVPWRGWLVLPVLTLGIVWALTPTIFWPMINDLWAVAKGRLAMSDADAVAVVHRWFAWDALRSLLIAIGFVSSLRAMNESHRGV